MAKKKQVEFSKERDRKWILELYPDNEMHMKVFEYLKVCQDFEIAYILHDKDIFEDDADGHKAGDLKKEHYHVYCRIRKVDDKPVNARYTKAFCKQIGYTLDKSKEGNEYAQFVKACESEKYMLRYLLHRDHPTRFQYDIDEVGGELKSKCALFCADSDKSEEENVNELAEMIINCEKKITYTELTFMLTENGFYKAYKGNMQHWKEVIREHNYEVEKKAKKARMSNLYKISTSSGTFGSYEEILTYFYQHDMQYIRIIEVEMAGIKMPVYRTMNVVDLEETVREELGD